MQIALRAGWAYSEALGSSGGARQLGPRSCHVNRDCNYSARGGGREGNLGVRNGESEALRARRELNHRALEKDGRASTWYPTRGEIGIEPNKAAAVNGRTVKV